MSTLSSFRRRLMVGAYPKEQPNYLCFTALEDGEFTLTMGANLSTSNFSYIEYSFDGNSWVKTYNVNSQTITVTTPTVSAGDKVYWRGSGIRNCQTRDGNKNNKGVFSSTCKFNASGSIASYLFYKKTDNILLTYDRSFVGLFVGCDTLVNASELILPENLSNDCFAYLFMNCTALEYGPSIPSGQMKQYCFNYSFYGCSSLKDTGKLLSTQLADSCYRYMYQKCTSLTTTHSLPAMDLVQYCYNNMYQGCTGLLEAGDIAATDFAAYCCQSMYDGCSNLLSTPRFTINTAAISCCKYMFYNDNKIVTCNVKINATTLYNDCFWSMFAGCWKMSTLPELPATLLVQNCYNWFCNNCRAVDYIKMLGIDISATNCLSNWVVNVKSSGIFVKHIDAQWTTTGYSGVPTNWTIIYYDPALDKYYTDQQRSQECDDHGNPI